MTPSKPPREAEHRQLAAMLEGVMRERNPQARGYRFEALVEALFKRNGFATTRNGGGARPRQTDLMASVRDLHCVVEAKWKRKPADVGDVDAIRARVRRQPPGTIGCLFSAGGFTRQAVALTEHDTAPEVLLFGRDEVTSLARFPVPLHTLIRRKQGALRHDGRMLLCAAGDLDREFGRGVSCQFTGLPNSAPSVTTPTAHFADLLHGRCPGTWAAYSVEYDFEPKDLGDLAKAFDAAQRALSDRLDGAFAIHQTRRSWFGFGFGAMVAEAKRWRMRYREALLSEPHHTETLQYGATLAEGAFALTARHFVGDTSGLLDARLTVQFKGIPTDSDPLRRLADALGVPPPPILPVPDDGGGVVWLRPPLPLKVRGQISSDEFAKHGEPRDVSGLVVENPFYRQPERTAKLLGKTLRFRGIDEAELLLCDLRSRHCIGDRVNGYVLTRVDARWVGDVHFVDAMADWSELVHCVRSKEDGVKRRAEFARSALAERNGGKRA